MYITCLSIAFIRPSILGKERNMRKSFWTTSLAASNPLSYPDMQTCIRTQVLLFCYLGRRKTSDQGCCCIWPVIKTQRSWQFSKTSGLQGRVLVALHIWWWSVCFRIFNLISEQICVTESATYGVKRLSLSTLFWHKFEASLQTGVTSAPCEQNNYTFQFQLSLRLLMYFLTPLVRPSLFTDGLPF